MSEQYSIMNMYHIFIHSSVNGCLGWFHVLAILNSIAKNIEVPVSFSIAVLSRCMTGSGIAGYYGHSIFNWGTCIPFSIVAALIYILTNRVWALPFLYNLYNI